MKIYIVLQKHCVLVHENDDNNPGVYGFAGAYRTKKEAEDDIKIFYDEWEGPCDDCFFVKEIDLDGTMDLDL